MSDTIREQIMQNRLTALQALLYDDSHTARTFKVVARAEASMFNPTQLPALYLYPGKETKTQQGLITKCQLQLMIEVSVLLDNTNADAKLNSLIQEVQAAMAANRSCGGLAESCYEVDNDFVIGIAATNGMPDRAVILMTYLVKYQHKADDPTKSS